MRGSQRRWGVVLAGCAAASACVFNPSVPPGAHVSCRVDGDCPDGGHCSAQGCLAPGVSLPSVAPFDVVTDEDTPVEFDLVAVDAGDTFAFALVDATAAGDVAVAASGHGTFTPALDQTGRDSFTVVVTTGSGLVSEPTVVAVDVAAQNDAPSFGGGVDPGGAIELACSEDTTCALNLLALADDVDADPIAFSAANGLHGLVEVTDGVALYTPDADYSGGDDFEVTAADDAGGSTHATVHVTIAAVNDAPRAEAAALSTPEDTPIIVTPTGSDVESPSVRFRVVVDVAAAQTLGSVVALDADADGTATSFTFTPAVGERNFNDHFDVVAVDEDGLAGASAQIDVHVGANLDAAGAVGPDAAIDENGVVHVGEDDRVDIVLCGRGDAERIDFFVATPPLIGNVFLDPENEPGPPPADCDVTRIAHYLPAVDANGGDRFEFEVVDFDGPSAPSLVTLTVDAKNDDPTSADASVDIAEDAAQKKILVPLADVDNALATLVVLIDDPQPVRGTVSATAGGVQYQPNADESGPDAVHFHVVDPAGGASAVHTLAIEVSPVADAPVAFSGAITTDEDTATLVVLDARDADGDNPTYVIDDVEDGSLDPFDAVHGAGLYRPPPDTSGTFRVHFHVNDVADLSGLDSGVAEFAITVSPVNDAPVVVTTAVRFDVSQRSEDFVIDARDVDGDNVTLTVEGQPSQGRAEVVHTAGAPDFIRYRPFARVTAFSDNFAIAAHDGVSDGAVTVVNVETVGRTACEEYVAQTGAAPEPAVSGLWLIDPGTLGGADRSVAFCDMDTAQGGWTLVAKSSTSTLAFESPLWSDDDTLAPDKPDRDFIEAKLPAFTDVPVGEVLIGVVRPGQTQIHSVRLNFNGSFPSLQEALSSSQTLFSPTPIGQKHWESLLGVVHNAAPCVLEGVNIAGPSSMAARIGMIASAAPCGQTVPNFEIGVGLSQVAPGGAVPGSPSPSTTNPVRIAYVLVRDALAGAASLCGDGCFDGDAGDPEDCDDGNTFSGDGCDGLCRVEVCGDGTQTLDEDCDDSNRVDGDGCDSNCTVTRCGNGIVTLPEECDGNLPDCAIIDTSSFSTLSAPVDPPLVPVEPGSCCRGNCTIGTLTSG